MTSHWESVARRMSDPAYPREPTFVGELNEEHKRLLMMVSYSDAMMRFKIVEERAENVNRRITL
jgi:hypothetical protein